MAWIESHDELPTHPKTRKAARRLSVSAPVVIGHLHVLWYWCLTFAPDGRLEGMDAEDLADAAQWDGDPETFAKALLAAGWLDDEDGTLVVHDWWDGAGKTILRRRNTTKRQRDRRARQAERDDEVTDDTHDEADESRDSHGDVTRDTRGGNTPDRDRDRDKDQNPGDAKRRKPDPIFDAIIEACGLDPGELTKSARGAANNAVKQLKDVGASPDGIKARAEVHRKRWPDAECTPSSLAKNYAQLGVSKLPSQARSVGTGGVAG